MKNRLLLSFIIFAFTCGFVTPQAFGEGLPQKILYEQGITAGMNKNCEQATKLLRKAQVIRKTSHGIDKVPAGHPVSRALVLAKDCKSGKITKETVEALFTSIHEANKNNWTLSLSLAQKVTQLAPKYAEGYVHMGSVCMKLAGLRGSTSFVKKAIKAYKSALKIEPKNGNAHLNLGVAYATIQQWKMAKVHLSLATSYGVIVPTELIAAIDSRVGGR